MFNNIFYKAFFILLSLTISLSAEELPLPQEQNSSLSSFIIGIGLSQIYHELDRNDNLANGEDPYKIYLSDGGVFTPFIMYNFPDRIWKEFNSDALGYLLLGYNFHLQYSTFRINKVYSRDDYQYKTDGITFIEGEFLYAVPLFYIKPGKTSKMLNHIKLGAGLGAGILTYNGTVVYKSASGSQQESISHRGDIKPVFMLLVEMGIGKWKMFIQGHNIGGSSDDESYYHANISLKFGYAF